MLPWGGGKKNGKKNSGDANPRQKRQNYPGQKIPAEKRESLSVRGESGQELKKNNKDNERADLLARGSK